MKPWERWAFNGLNIVVAITGLAYLYMKYVLPSDDPFAVVNHPWQSSMLSLHVVVATPSQIAAQINRVWSLGDDAAPDAVIRPGVPPDNQTI